MRARRELATRWLVLLSLCMIAGLGGGAAISAFAGARRTVSVYPRFRAATHAFDDLIGVNGGGELPSDEVQTQLLSSVQHLPAITDASLTDAYIGELVGPSGPPQSFPEVFIIGTPDGKIGVSLDRMKLQAGRYADPARADEVMVSTFEATKLGAHVGSTLTLRLPDATRTLRVVGIGILAGAVDPAAAAYTPVVILTPAFYAQSSPVERAGPTLAVAVRGGQAGMPELERELATANQARIRVAKDKRSAASITIDSSIGAAPQNDSVRRTALFEAVGLSVFGGLALLTVLAIFAQLLARQIFLESGEQSTLRALGMSGSQLFALSMIRVVIVGVGACIVSVGIAVAASTLFPIGFMRVLETSPGVHIDLFTIAVGAAAIFLLIVLVGILPAFRSATRTAPETSVGTNRVANALAVASFPPTAVAGIRMALEPGRGSTTVPVRTTIVGTVLALAALNAALMFGGGLRHLVSTPSLSGWNFDAILPGFGAPPPGQPDPFPDVLRTVRTSAVVRSVALGTLPNFEIDGVFMTGFAFAPGPFGPSIATGRAPHGTAEIALSTKTMRALHTSIGRSVTVRVIDPATNQPDTGSESLEVVGAAVAPQLFFTQYSGRYSAVVSEAFIDSFHIPGVRPGGDSLYVRFRSGVSADAGTAALRSELPPAAGSFILRRSSTSDLANLDRIGSLPNILAGLLALVAAGTLAHTLITSVRRRRKDLAVLRALGFVRGQVVRTVAWQATTIALISLVIGLTLGTVAGRLAWSFFVDQLGYVPVNVTPGTGIAIAILATIVLANLIASAPARAAAHVRPAEVLRTE